MLTPRMTESRTIVSLDGLWMFRLDYKNEGIESNWHQGVPETRPIAVPASYNDLYTEQEIRDFVGDAWYEKTFSFHPEGERLVLRFGSVTHRATVWLNDHELGGHEGGFLPFEFDVTSLLKHGMNRLVVKVNNELSYHSLPVGVTQTKWNGKKYHHPAFDFFNYSGIHRSVLICSTPKKHIEDITLIPSYEGNTGKIDYVVETNGDDDVIEVRVRDSGKTIATQNGRQGTLDISDVNLWSPDNPYLYEVDVRYGKDVYTLKTGIRKVEIRGNRFLLNDKPVYFKGFGKHDDFDIIGKGFNLPVMIRDFELLKWIGANSVRTTHYPYPEEFYDLADQYGILVIDEVPAVGMWKRSSDLNAMGKKPYFAEEGVMTKTMENHKNQLAELVKRDKNHPCVVIWSVANEPATDEDASLPYFEEIFAYARTLDPQKRPIGFVNCGIAPPNTCRISHLGDILMLNRYSGWYYLNGAQFSLAKGDLKHELKGWVAKYDKPIIMTEYGADTLSGMHQLPSVMFSEEYLVDYLNAYHEAFDEFESVIGEHPWNFADFNTEQGLQRVGGNKKGIFTRNRQPKMAAHILRERWLNKIDQ